MATGVSDSKVPDWVQAEIFTDVLKESVEGFLKIKSFKAAGGSAAGENYATIMLRVNIEVELKDGKEKSVSYMLKLPHQSEIFQAMMKRNNIFEAERTVYKTIVPEMEQLYRDAGVEVKFGAKSYDLKDAKSDYVLLEDLAPQGFKNMNRLEGLDQAHTESALRKLSQWHAASVVRVAHIGPYPEKYNTGFFTEESRPVIEEMNSSLTKSFLKSLATYEDSEEYLTIVKALQPRIHDEVYKMVKIDPNEFNALNHGDFWSNNMMYSHDSFGKIKEIYLVDFQLPKFGSIAQDLYYFLLSSTKFEDKLTKFDYYIKFYHESLVEHLKLLKYSKAIPSLRDIHLSLFKNGLWGYITATSVMSGILLDPTEAASVENFLSDTTEGNDFKNLLYSNPRYRKHIQAVLPWLLNRGALDP
ncbi:hypothetical protein KR215_011410 [Drosophila sulfurigaster]|nr:hypothetical protein KR215_011410 [Drosophila sulfurigaster]